MNNTGELKFLISVNAQDGIASVEQFKKSVGDLGPKAGEVGKDVGTLTNQIGALPSALQNVGKAAQKGSSDFRKAWGEMALSVNQTLDIFKKGYDYLQQGVAQFKEVAEFSEAKENFRILAASFGQNADFMLAKLEQSVGGQVDQFSLVRESTKALALGVTHDVDEMSKLWEIAKTKGDLYGQSTKDTFNQIVSAIANGTPRILVQLGLIPESFARISDPAELAAKKVEILSAVLSSGSKDLALFGSATSSTADEIDRLEAGLKNTKLYLLESFLPAVNNSVQFLNNSVIPSIKTVIELYERYGAILGRFEAQEAQIKATPKADLIERKVVLENTIKAYKLGPDSPQVAELSEIMAGLSAKKKQKESDTLWKNLSEAGDSFLDSFLSKKELEGFKGRADLAKTYWENYLKDAKKAADDKEKLGKTSLKKFEDETKALLQREEERHKKFLEYSFSEKGIAEGLAGLTYPNLANAIAGVSFGYAQMGDASRKFIEDAKKTAPLMKAITDYAAQIEEGNPKLSAFGNVLDNTSYIMGAVIQSSGGLGDAFYQIPFEVVGKRADALKDKLKELGDLAPLVNKISTASLSAVGGSPTGLIGLGVAEMNRVSTSKETKAWVKEASETLAKESKEKLSKAFSDALLEGARNGNYLDALKQGLRSAVAEAFNQKFPVMSSTGGLNLGNLGINVAAGAVLNRLTGAGGIFGTSVIHGQENAANTTSINEQVKKAQTDQRELLTSLVGISKETRDAIASQKFSYASTITNKSGDGIFSKKTTTYETVGATEAGKALKEFAEITTKAQAEATQRSFDIALTEISDPAKALDMTIEDLRKAVEALGGAAESMPYQLQLAQLEAQKTAQRAQQAIQKAAEREAQTNSATNSWLDLALTSGDPQALAKAKSYVGQTLVSPTARGTPVLTSRSDGSTFETKGFYYNPNPYTPDYSSQVGAIDRYNQDSYSFGLLSGDEALTAQKIKINSVLGEYESMMATIKIKMQTVSNTEEQQAELFNKYQKISSAYWDGKNDLLTIEKQLEESNAAKKEESNAAKKNEEIEATQKANDFRNKWTNMALQNASLTTGQYRNSLKYYSNTAKDPNQFGDMSVLEAMLVKQSGENTLASEMRRMSIGSDSNLQGEYLKERLINAKNEAAFFLDLMDKNYAIAMDGSDSSENRIAGLERAKLVQDKYNETKIEILNIEAQQNEAIINAQKAVNTSKTAWLSQATQSSSILDNFDVRKKFTDLIGTGSVLGRINTDAYGTGIKIYEQAAAADYNLEQQRMASGTDSTQSKSYYDNRKRILSANESFFLDIANREQAVSLDLSKTLEEREMAGDRFKVALNKFYESKKELLGLDQEQENAIKEAMVKTISFQDSWLNLALGNSGALGDSSMAGLLRSNIQNGTWSDTADLSWLPNEFNLRKSGQSKSFDLQKLGIQAGNDPEKLKAYQAEELKSAQDERAFFEEIAAREEQMLADRTKTYEEQRAHVERYFKAKEAANNAELKGLQIQKQQQDDIAKKADELKSKQESMFYDLMGNLMNRVIEVQEKGSITNNFLMPGQTPAQRILEVMKATVAGQHPELASVMNDVISVFEEYGIQ